MVIYDRIFTTVYTLTIDILSDLSALEHLADAYLTAALYTIILMNYVWEGFPGLH